MDEKYALVTGTSSGLGLSMANCLLDEGYIVFGLSRSGSNISHGCYVDIICDVRDEPSVENAYQIIEETTDGLHIIINNAGIIESDPLTETSLKDFKLQLETNVVGPFLIWKHSANFLIENETHLITISSLAAKQIFPNLSAFSATKHALEGMIKTLKKEWAHLHLSFTTFYPGPIDTPLWDNMDVDQFRETMLSIEDFMKVFEQTINSPKHLQFDEITFFQRGSSA